MVKRIPVILLLGFLFLFPSWVQSQPDKFFERLLGPVIADVERTPYRMDAAREFCAKPYGWSLRP